MFNVVVDLTNPKACDAFVIANHGDTVVGTEAEVRGLYEVLKNYFEPKEDCGCGGCEDAIAECMVENNPNDELVELEEFIGAVYRLIEEYRRAEDEMQ